MADVFREIATTDDELLDAFWLPLYRRSFPADERVPEDEIRQAAASPDGHLLVGCAAAHPISMARYDVGSDDRGSGFAYLMYMAVDEQAVSRGHGQQMFREIVRRSRTDATRPRVLIFEVQRPATGGTDAPGLQNAGRRIAFYRRLGAHVLGGVHYVQHVPGQPGVPMYLMYLPLHSSARAVEALSAASELFGADVQVLDHDRRAIAGDG